MKQFIDSLFLVIFIESSAFKELDHRAVQLQHPPQFQPRQDVREGLRPSKVGSRAVNTQCFDKSNLINVNVYCKHSMVLFNHF